MAFWSAFLLIHLGGTDFITAFSLEDNALWLRHLVGLAVQVAVFFYVFLKTLPDNNLMLPTAFVFLAGVNNYAEWTRALYLTSLENLKNSIFQSSTSGPENDGPDETSKDQVLAERFFRTFKGLVVDIMPSYAERSRSRDFFTKFLAVSSQWGIALAPWLFAAA